MIDKNHTVVWHRTGGTATQPPNLKYPDGVDVGYPAQIGDDGPRLRCKVAIPYPAAGIGHWIISCKSCGMTVACTAAGRRDDPRSITMACRTRKPDWSKT